MRTRSKSPGQRRSRANSPNLPTIADAIERFGTLDAVAQALREFPQFDRVNRSTIQRWRKLEQDLRNGRSRSKSAQARIRRAAQLLLGRSQQRHLRVPYYEAPLFVPVMLVQEPTRAYGAQGPAFATTYGIT